MAKSHPAPSSVPAEPSAANPATPIGTVAPKKAAKAPPGPFTAPPPGNLLRSITVEHGPEDVLGRFFLQADDACRRRGVSLSFVSFQDLLDANEINAATWKPVNTMYDPRYSRCTPENAFVILGRNIQGDVVACQVGRVFTPAVSMKDEFESLRVFFEEPEKHKLPGEYCEVTAPSASTLKGRVLLGGAAWYRPDYRGRELSSIIPRISRAYAYTRWNTNITMSLFMEGPARGGVIEMAGYNRGEWHLHLKNARDGSPRCCIAWMYPDELEADLGRFMSTFDAQPAAQIDGAVGEGRA